MRIDGTQADVVRIDVHNMGAVPIDLIPKMFDPMTGGERRREKSHGLGLGLFITQQIARAHGGRVDVVSTETVGTTFTVALPRITPGAEKPVTGRSYLIVAIPQYLRWDQPEVAQ